jgi:D-aminopeptidase
MSHNIFEAMGLMGLTVDNDQMLKHLHLMWTSSFCTARKFNPSTHRLIICGLPSPEKMLKTALVSYFTILIIMLTGDKVMMNEHTQGAFIKIELSLKE